MPPEFALIYNSSACFFGNLLSIYFIFTVYGPKLLPVEEACLFANFELTSYNYQPYSIFLRLGIHELYASLTICSFPPYTVIFADNFNSVHKNGL